MQTRTVKVFLSCPSDVLEYADLAKKYINETLSQPTNGWVFVAQHFSDIASTISGKSAQEVINHKLQDFDCDLYIGIMGEKFGTPTKNFESGTEEEFCFCLDKFEKTRSPKISFLFKPPELKMSDASVAQWEQWTKVKKFRDSVVSPNGLYKNFDSEDDLRKCVHQIIDNYKAEAQKTERYNATHADDRTEETIKLKESFFAEWLDYPGKALSSGVGTSISLSEIYTSPKILKRESSKDEDGDFEKFSKPFDFESKLKTLPSNLAIIGDEGSGKTTLLKRIYQQAYEDEARPVYVNLEDLSKSKFTKVDKLYLSLLKEQYKLNDNVDLNKIPKSKRYLLVDNFDAAKINSSAQLSLLNKLREYAGTLVITVGLDFFSSKAIVPTEFQSRLLEFDCWEIQEFSDVKINQLVKKWVSIKPLNNNQGMDTTELAKQYFSKLKSVLGYNYVPRCPFVILVTLLGLSGGDEAAELRHPSFVRYYDYLLNKHIFATFPELQVELAHNFFPYLAHKIYSSDKGEVDESSIKNITDTYAKNFDLQVEKVEEVFSSALASGIIINSSGSFKFRHNYAYYYFATKYWSENISSEEVKDTIVFLIDNLNLKQSSSLLIFLAYQNKDEQIIKTLLAKLRSSFANESEFGFDRGASAKVNKLIDVAPTFILNETSEAKENIIEAEEKSQRAITNVDTPKSSGGYDLFESYIISLRQIEVAGQILKSHVTKLNGDVKYELFESSLQSGLRLTNAVFEKLFKEPEELVDYLNKRLKHEANKEEIKRFVFFIANAIIASQVSSWSKYLSLELLEPTSSRVLEFHQSSLMYQIINFAINLENKQDLRMVQIEEIVQKSKNDRLALSVVRLLVLHNLYGSINERETEAVRRRKQKICDLLKIDRKKILAKKV